MPAECGDTWTILNIACTCCEILTMYLCNYDWMPAECGDKRMGLQNYFHSWNDNLNI